MVLEALLDVDLALLNFDIDRADLPLNRTQNIHHLSKASIIRWRKMSNLRGGGSCMLITLYWRRLRCFALTLKTKLSIRLHESMTPKRILNLHLGLNRDVCHKLKIDRRDQARKRKPYRMIISHIKHSVEDVLAQAKGHPHSQSMQKTSPLQYKLNPMSCGPEIVQNNLREQQVQGRKGTDLDVSVCSLFALRMGIKEVQ
jgi:hypothetical protein